MARTSRAPHELALRLGASPGTSLLGGLRRAALALLAGLLAACPDGGLDGSLPGDFPPEPGRSPGAPCRPADHPSGPCDQALGGADFVNMTCLSGTCVVDCTLGGDFLCREVVADFLTCSDLAGGACVRACGPPDDTCPEGFSCFTLEGSCLPTGAFPTSPCRDDPTDACDADLAGVPGADMVCVRGQCAVGCADGGGALCRQVDASLTCSAAAGHVCVPDCAAGCPEGFSCLDRESACLPTGAFPGSPCAVPDLGDDPTCGALADRDAPGQTIPMECRDDRCVIACDAAADGDARCAAADPSLGCSAAAGACVPLCEGGACPDGFSCFSREDRCLPTGSFPTSPCLPGDACLALASGEEAIAMACLRDQCVVPCEAGAAGDGLCGAIAPDLGCSGLAGVCVTRCEGGACAEGFSCFSQEDRCLPTGAFPGSPCRADAETPCDQDLGGNPNLDMRCTAADVCAIDCAAGGDFVCGLADPSLGCSAAAGGVCVPRCGPDGACGPGAACFAGEGVCLPIGAFPGSPCAGPDGLCGEVGGLAMVCAEPDPAVGPICLVPCDAGGTATCQAVSPTLSCFAGGAGPALCLPNGAFPESLCRAGEAHRCDAGLQGQRDLNLTCITGTCQVDCTRAGDALCGLYAAGVGAPPGAFRCVDTGATGGFCARAGCASAGVACPAHYHCDGYHDACLPYLPIHVIHTNDLHSHLDGLGPVSAPRAGGYAGLATLVHEARARAEARGGLHLTVDAGDWIMGTLFHVLQGTVEFDLFRYLAYDAVAVGNHELDWGPAGLALFLSKNLDASPIMSAAVTGVLGCNPGSAGCPALAPVPVLASNLLFDPMDPGDDALEVFWDPTGELDPGVAPLKPFTIVERAGLRVGIFGLLGEGAYEVTPTAAPLGLEDPTEAARAMTALLRAAPYEVDLVVALSHSGSAPPPLRDEDELIADEVDGLDLIVSGHTHELVAPKRVGDTWVVQAWEYGRVLGELELAIPTLPWVGGGGRPDPHHHRFTPHEPVHAVPDPVVLTARAAYIGQINLAFQPAGLTYSHVLGGIAEDMVKASAAESALGNLVTDASRHRVSARLAGTSDPTPVEVAIEANGVLRDDLLTIPGASLTPVTFADAFAVEPLGASPTEPSGVGYPMVEVYLTGDDLRRVLEVATTLTFLRGDDFWLHASGIRWVYDLSRPSFQRVRGIWLEPAGAPANVCSSTANILRPDGIAKDPARRYRVAANLYVAGFLSQLGELTGGALSVTPTNATGSPVSVYDRVVVDPTTGAEVRQWQVLVEHLAGLAGIHSGLIPTPSAGRVLDWPAYEALCL